MNVTGFAKLDGRFRFDVQRLLCEQFWELGVFPSWAWVKHWFLFQLPVPAKRLIIDYGTLYSNDVKLKARFI